MTLTEAKTAFAGVMFITSLAIFMASIAAFNEEITPSRRFGRWDFASMAGMGNRKKERGAQAVHVRP